jgi:sulfur-oxidizing protein SoxY
MRASGQGRLVMTANPPTRRELIGRSGAFCALLGCGLLGYQDAGAAELELAFDAKSLDEALEAMGNVHMQSQKITLALADVIDNGAFAPVSVSSALPRTQEISIVVESNPNPLVVHFRIPAGTEPYVSTRVKMAGSGRVYAVVKADGKVYSTFRETKVTVGGCG